MRQVYKKCDACNRGYVPSFDFEHGQTYADGTCLNLSLCTKCGGKGYIETDLFVEDSPTDELGLSHELPDYNGNLLPEDLNGEAERKD